MSSLGKFSDSVKTVGFRIAAGLLIGQERIELRRSTAGHAQGLPFARSKVLGEKHDLADVIRIMRELSVDRLDDAVRFATDRDLPRKVIRRQRSDTVEKRLPTALPKAHKALACIADHLEFGIAIAVRLLAVSRQKITPTRMQISGDMLYDHRDGIRLGIDLSEKLIVGQLLDRPLRKTFVAAE